MIFVALIAMFVCGLVCGIAIPSSGRGTQSSPEDKIIHEMRMQRTRDYFNNPVVNEMKREFNTKKY